MRLTRRWLEATVLVVVLVEVARTGLGKLWAKKAFDSTAPGSLSHDAAEVAVIIT